MTVTILGLYKIKRAKLVARKTKLADCLLTAFIGSDSDYIIDC